jgi:hypothetical protein
MAVAVALALGAVGVFLAGQAAGDTAAVRVPSGCTTVVEVSGGTRFVISTELDGPALGSPESCVDVPAGRRAITAVRVSVDGSEASPVVPGGDVSIRLAPGRHEVTVIAEGSPGEAVAVIQADARQSRADARITAAVLLVAALSVVALVPVIGRRRQPPGGPGTSGGAPRPVIAVTAGPWAPPDPSDRRG